MARYGTQQHTTGPAVAEGIYLVWSGRRGEVYCLPLNYIHILIFSVVISDLEAQIADTIEYGKDVEKDLGDLVKAAVPFWQAHM